MKYIVPAYVDDGMKVIAPLSAATGIWGVVTSAAGKSARVKTRLFEKWFHIDELRIPNPELEVN
jgi:hypothetical protein